MNRAGIYVDNLTGEAAYKSFKPNPLPPIPEITMDEACHLYLLFSEKESGRIL